MIHQEELDAPTCKNRVDVMKFLQVEFGGPLALAGSIIREVDLVVTY